MSLNKLVGGDCGGNNPLVQLSQIVSRDAAPQFSQADRFVNEFMAQTSGPQTFNMNALLNNIPEVEKVGKSSNGGQKINQVSNLGPQTSMPWMPGPSSFMSSQSMFRPFPILQQPMLHHQGPSNVQIQYISESELQKSENDDVKAKATEYVDNFKEDDELAYNQFMSFMKKMSAGEINFTEPVQGEQRKMSKDEILDEMAEKYKDEWAKLSDVNDYWSSEAANGISEEYNFTEGNVMLENKSALEIGKEKLKMGDIPGAVLCFEAAAQQQPDSAEAWYLLGTTQAENEQDPLAITALKKSLAIDPRQLDAYITLAAAYTNENLPKFAFISLLDWLKASKYNDLLPNDIDPKKLDLKDLESHVKMLFLRAAQINPSQIDPDVQNALGVMFNISQEYDKAVDCFRTALMVANDDAKLWNRLGATLANSDKSEEAVDAYHQALNLEPGFIRARYNVGITCMNLGAHKEAAEHFLVALNQQLKAKSMYPDSSSNDTSSSTIWTTLRMVCSFMGEHDVAKLVDERNLTELNKFFDLE
ncbi:peroxisomal targeting signal 1 receptor [Pectinophora gossypiella]|uniref:peroxisomal targeting signal 1 receptor n=1 Tax=Pectinophora gossypiella TaxID=13191 RepID=UPI00214EF54E|nr:peroxisomal targeting signal 1 receptor [Pectinophora gossypiella]